MDFFPLEVTVKDSVEKAAQYMLKKGGCDVLICNAGIAYKGDTFDEPKARHTFEVNYFGVKSCLEAFCPIMKKDGRIITVSSRAGDFGKLSPAVTFFFIIKLIGIFAIIFVCYIFNDVLVAIQ